MYITVSATYSVAAAARTGFTSRGSLSLSFLNSSLKTTSQQKIERRRRKRGFFVSCRRSFGHQTAASLISPIVLEQARSTQTTLPSSWIVSFNIPFLFGPAKCDTANTADTHDPAQVDYHLSRILSILLIGLLPIFLKNKYYIKVYISEMN